jgi:hypothetical protein
LGIREWLQGTLIQLARATTIAPTVQRFVNSQWQIEVLAVLALLSTSWRVITPQTAVSQLQLSMMSVASAQASSAVPLSPIAVVGLCVNPVL